MSENTGRQIADAIRYLADTHALGMQDISAQLSDIALALGKQADVIEDIIQPDISSDVHGVGMEIKWASERLADALENMRSTGEQS